MPVLSVDQIHSENLKNTNEVIRNCKTKTARQYNKQKKSATYQLIIYKILHKNNNIRPPAPPLLGKTGMKSGAIE